jgi:hypothetical protein
MDIRRTVRDLHRRGTEDYAVVENTATDTATVRLAVGGKRLTNLPVISTVEIGDRVVVDYSTGKPYVRPVTLSDEEVVLDLGDDATGEISQSETGRLWVTTGNDFILTGNYGVETTSPIGAYIPNLTHVHGDGELSSCPYFRFSETHGLSPYGKNLPHLATPGKYMVTTSFDVSIGPKLDGFTLPMDNVYSVDLFAFWITSYRFTTQDNPRGSTRYRGRQRRYCWWKDKDDVKTFHNSSIIATEQPDTWAYPEVLVWRPSFQGKWPYYANRLDYTVSNVKCQVMLIAKLSEKPRSTFYSHWDEWYAKYPQYI